MLDKYFLLKDKFNEIKKMGWIKSYRCGATGIGYTFEKMIGKEEDSLCYPDFNGIEIKTHRIKSKSHLCLFNYNPIGESTYELKRIFDQYGYISKIYTDTKILSTSIFSHYTRDIGTEYKFSLDVDTNN